MSKSIRISKLGRGLTVLISCEATGADNFLAFASWYSLTKNLPDAQIVIACRRPLHPSMDVFPWVYRLQVPFFYHQKDCPDIKVGDSPILMIPADTMCLQPLDDDLLMRLSRSDLIVDGHDLCLPAKTFDPVVFCSLRDGCGLFVPSKWLHKGGHPFRRTDLYEKGTLTLNEKRVFSLWKKLCPLYDTIV